MSCSGTKKQIPNSIRTGSDHLSVSEKTLLSAQEADIEVSEEKLVHIDNTTPDPHKYFVIVGSFRNPENVRRFQTQVLKEGFTPGIVRNEAGLFRIYILASDDQREARAEILRVRSEYPRYNDTWLLVQKR